MSFKLVLRTLMALVDKDKKDLMYKFYVTDLLTNIARSQGIEIKKQFSEIYIDSLDKSTYKEEETSGEVIEKTCKLFRAFNDE